MKNNYEKRAAVGVELREAAKDSGFIATLAGYAAVFNSNSAPIMNEQRKRPFIERIAPGAFKESVSEERAAGNEVLAFWSHDESRPLGRRGANLRVSEDDRGLRFELDVVDTTAGRDLVTNVRTGIVNGVSFGFSVQEEIVERGTDFDTRTLQKVRLYEISPTAVPAYAATSIDFRSHDKLCEAPAETRSIGIKAGEAVAVDPPVATAPTEKLPPALEPFTQSGARAARFGLR